MSDLTTSTPDLVEAFEVEIRCGACARRHTDTDPPVLAKIDHREWADRPPAPPSLSVLAYVPPEAMLDNPKAQRSSVIVIAAGTDREREVPRRNLRRLPVWRPVTGTSVELSCRRSTCRHRQTRNTAKLIKAACVAARRGEHVFLV